MSRVKDFIGFCIITLFTIGFASALQHARIVSGIFSLGGGDVSKIYPAIVTYEGSSKFQCAQKCMSRKVCQSFSFDPETKTCVLQNGGLHKNTTDVEDVGQHHSYIKVDGCPRDYIWSPAAKLCFKLYPDKTKNYNTSKRICKVDHYKSRMAVLNSDDKLKLIQSQIKKTRNKVFCLWVGAEKDNDGEYRQWDDGSQIADNLWGTGEPNDRHASCVNLHGKVDFQLNDESCDYNCNVVCEIPSSL